MAPEGLRVHFFVCLFSLLVILAGCSEPEKDPQKDTYGNLELNGKINTFPLCIVLSDRLSGPDFPADLKALCGFSTGKCKTLPIAGILRSGADIYYTYNCFADLKIPGSAAKNEAGITQAVAQQVSTYYSNTKLATYDSLLIPNQPEWNVKNMPATYISNTSDSVFFYSNKPGFSSTIQVNSRTYPVYNDVAELRTAIDIIICNGYEKIAIFYNPVTADESNTPGIKFAMRGALSGDTCVQNARYQKLHNGKGGFMLGKLLQANSGDCGFASLPVTSAAAEKPISKPVAVPAPATARVKKQADAAGENPAPIRGADNQCARRSEPLCEKDDSQNFTGRRVRYCYNREGKIIRTIVISKCESDCRCF